MRARSAAGDAGDDQVLVRRQAELAASRLVARCAISRRPLRCGAAVAVPDAAGVDAQRQVPAAVIALDPAEAVAVVDERERPRRREREAGAAFDLGLEPVQAAVVDGVLQARALAHVAVAEVALRGDHGLGDGDAPGRA